MYSPNTTSIAKFMSHEPYLHWWYLFTEANNIIIATIKFSMLTTRYNLLKENRVDHFLLLGVRF